MATVTALTIPLGGSASAANFGTQICLANNPSSCVDVSNGVYHAGQPLWVFQSGATGLGFSEIQLSPGVCDGENTNGCGGRFFPFTDHFFDGLYDGDAAIVLSPTQSGASNLCIGESGGNVMLKTGCGGSLDAEWIVDGQFLINPERTNATDDAAFLSAAGTSNKSALTASTVNHGWQRWKLTCVMFDC
jgi:hypothetical protein